MPTTDLAWQRGRVREVGQVFCCAEGPGSSTSSTWPASGESWHSVHLETRPLQVNRAEASWNQNTYKSWPLCKMSPRSINTSEVVIEMSSYGCRWSDKQLSEFKSREIPGSGRCLLANLCVSDWNVAVSSPLHVPAVRDPHPCCRVPTRDCGQVSYLHQFSILRFNANPPLPAGDGEAKVWAE